MSNRMNFPKLYLGVKANNRALGCHVGVIARISRRTAVSFPGKVPGYGIRYVTPLIYFVAKHTRIGQPECLGS